MQDTHFKMTCFVKSVQLAVQRLFLETYFNLINRHDPKLTLGAHQPALTGTKRGFGWTDKVYDNEQSCMSSVWNQSRGSKAMEAR